MTRAAAVLVALLVLASAGVACVQQPGLPGDCDAGSVLREASLTGDKLDPEGIDVCKGQDVTIEITTQRAGELHLHGYDAEAPGVPVEPGDTATFHFTATRAGQFPLELHDEETGTESEVGILTVHEP